MKDIEWLKIWSCSIHDTHEPFTIITCYNDKIVVSDYCKHCGTLLETYDIEVEEEIFEEIEI